MNITNDPYIQNMFQSRNLRPATITSYTKIIQPYCEFIGKTPTQLINEAIDEEEQGIRKINRKIRTYQITYRQHLIQHNKSPLTIKNTMATIRSFYNEYEIELPKIKINVPLEEKLITKEDLIQKKDIIHALKHANIKYKAIILLMISSGMGSIEVRNLTINNFLKSIEIAKKEPLHIGELIQKADKNNIPCATWKIIRIKTGMPYFTFSSPESITAILDYLQQREIKQGPLQPDSYLFDVEGHKTASKSFVNYFDTLNKKCGFGKFGRQNFFKAHNLRKYFATTLQEHGVQSLIIEWMLGHKVPIVTGTYIKPDVTALRHDYLRVLPYLSIEKVETRTVNSPEFKELQELIKLQQEQINELREISNLNFEYDQIEALHKK